MKTIAREERLGESTLNYIDGDGTNVSIKPIIGIVKVTPERDAFVCQVMIEGIFTRPQIVYGANSFQAVCLAFRYLAYQLRETISTEPFSPLPSDNFDPSVEEKSMNWFDMLATCPASSCTTAQPPLSLCGPKDNVEILNLAAELAIDLKRENSLDQLELILGRPVFFENHWTCMFVINGLLPGPEIVTAGESLHALCLAIRRVHGFLSGVSGQLYSRDQKLSRTLIPLDLQHYFHSKLEP